MRLDKLSLVCGTQYDFSKWELVIITFVLWGTGYRFSNLTRFTLKNQGWDSVQVCVMPKPLSFYQATFYNQYFICMEMQS